MGCWLETSILVGVLSGMILLAGLQIVLRNFVGAGFSWVDEALRLMVLWIAMIGAVAASREYRHISIDILSRFLPPTARLWSALIVDLFTAGVSLALCWYSYEFVAFEFDDKAVLLGNLPAWPFEAVLPVAFGLIGYRYIVWSLTRIKAIIRREQMP
ncbi:uncharacterized protein METZ01_LOCUS116278 [marine metagenome]|uniref:Tripartite ATP-independent periplasmic transporters DctQ component domain-containing protein n=1 Tax=marine metagenome TaxID=408172 RepID=A0A381XF83_9ZZZZ